MRKRIIIVALILIVITILLIISLPSMLRGVFTVDKSVQTVMYQAPDNSPKFICPENYTNNVKRDDDLRVFITTYATAHPNATVGEFTAYRNLILEQNNCLQTINNINQHNK